MSLDLLNRSVGPKAKVPTTPPLFPAGEISLPWLEKCRTLDLLVFGNRGPLMLVCSITHVTGVFSIFGDTFSAAFVVSHRFETPIKGRKVMGFLLYYWLVLNFQWVCMARRCRYCAFTITPELNVMLTGIGRRLSGTCWSMLIFFWRDIFEPYMPPYTLLRSGIVQRCCSHNADPWPGLFLFSYPL